MSQDVDRPGNEDIVSLNAHELDVDELDQVAGGTASVDVDIDPDPPCSSYCRANQ